MLGRSHILPSGVRVGLRLARGGDIGAVASLHTRLNSHVDDIDLRRLLRFDHRRHLAICATTWTGRSETLVGFAVAEPGAQPDALLADEHLAPGVGDLLLRALREGLGGLQVA